MLDGGGGFDTADYSDKKSGVMVTINRSKQVDVFVGGAVEDRVRNVENITGGSSSDALTGDKKANVLEGGRGDDTLDGAKASDSLDGGKGNDTLIGGLGNDTLTGGAGRDEFVFSAKPGPANVDVIADFASGIDMVHLSDAVFRAVGPTLDPSEFHAAAGAVAGQDRNDRIVYDTATGHLYYDADGRKAGGVDPVLFATLTGKPVLDASDFVIV